jgi:hypothetical protein
MHFSKTFLIEIRLAYVLVGRLSDFDVYIPDNFFEFKLDMTYYAFLKVPIYFSNSCEQKKIIFIQ